MEEKGSLRPATASAQGKGGVAQRKSFGLHRGRVQETAAATSRGRRGGLFHVKERDR